MHVAHIVGWPQATSPLCLGSCFLFLFLLFLGFLFFCVWFSIGFCVFFFCVFLFFCGAPACGRPTQHQKSMIVIRRCPRAARADAARTARCAGLLRPRVPPSTDEVGPPPTPNVRSSAFAEKSFSPFSVPSASPGAGAPLGRPRFFLAAPRPGGRTRRNTMFRIIRIYYMFFFGGGSDFICDARRACSGAKGDVPGPRNMKNMENKRKT